MNSNDLHDFYINDWPNFCFSGNSAMISGSMITSGECIFFALSINTSMSILQTWLCDEVIVRLDLFHDIKSQNIEIWLCMDMSQNVFKLPLKQLLVALIGLGVHTKDCTSPACILSINILNLSFSPDPTKLLVVRLLSVRIDNTNSKLLRRYWANSQRISSWTTFLNSSIQHWGVWMFSLYFVVEFHDSKHWYSWRQGAWFPWSSVPFLLLWNSIFLQVCNSWYHTHFISCPGPINVRWPCGICCAYNFTLSEFEIQVSSVFLFSHSM